MNPQEVLDRFKAMAGLVNKPITGQKEACDSELVALLIYMDKEMLEFSYEPGVKGPEYTLAYKDIGHTTETMDFSTLGELEEGFQAFLERKQWANP